MRIIDVFYRDCMGDSIHVGLIQGLFRDDRIH